MNANGAALVPGSNTPLLVAERLHAYYGQSHILQGLSLVVHPAEVVVLLGRNGVGKTTTLRALVGLVDRVEGDLWLGGKSLVGQTTFERARAGLVFVPSGRRTFARLTVRENLLVAARGNRSSERRAIDEVLEIFPALRDRLDVPAGVLSGGQNQMLKVARALLAKPKVLLLDEPTEGLAPYVVQEVGEQITMLAGRGVGILLAEQNMHFALGLSRHAYVLDKGTVRIERHGDQLADDPEIRQALGI